MIALWVAADEADVESYLATLILPAYLAHLELAPFRYERQAGNRDGREPLVATYVGQGRREEYRLDPRGHALGLIRHLNPRIVTARVQLPQDDAGWFWPASNGSSPAMRVYFAPTSQVLGETRPCPAPEAAHISVSGRHAFVSRGVLDEYLLAWMRRLGIDGEKLAVDTGATSGSIEWTFGRCGGQLQLDDPATANDLLRFAGLLEVLEDVSGMVAAGWNQSGDVAYEIRPDGVYIQLAARE